MKNRRTKAITPLLLFFVILTALLVTGKGMLERWGLDRDVVIIGNILLFLITLLSFNMGLKGLRDPNPHAFVRSVYSSILLKLFLCIIAAFIYISLYGNNLNKPALFTCMGLYLVYTFMEVSTLMKLLKDQSHE